jgi:diguanylate cyclase (GGDEF)-like protein
MRSIQPGPTAFRAVLPRVALWALALFAPLLARAERGFPLITVYPAEVHEAGPQTFDIAQDPRGVLYFGNLHGLITYDGAWWRLLKLPDDQLALTVAADAKGRVVTGLVNDFGYVDGSQQYRSLLPQIPKEHHEFGDVRATCVAANGFLFVTERRLFFWDGGKVRVLGPNDPKTGPRGCYAEDGRLLVFGPNGVQRLDLASGQLGPMLLGGWIDLVLRGNDGAILAVQRDKGVFDVRGAQPVPFSPEVSAWMNKKIATGGCRLEDGRLVIATRQHGVIVVDRNGKIEQAINDKTGLPDAVISEVFVDHEGSLWIAMDSPIVRIDVAAPVSLFDTRRGLKGGVNDIARFQGELYAATSHGLHRIDAQGNVHYIDGVRDGWRLLPVDDELLIGTSRGIYTMRKGEIPQHVIEREGEIYDLSRSSADPSRIWLAQRIGVGSIRRVNGAWIAEETIAGSPEYASSVVERNGELWAGTVFEGIVRIRNPRAAKPELKLFGDGETTVFRAGGRVIGVHSAGDIFSVDRDDKYIRDPLLGHLEAPRGFFGVVEDASGAIWINSTPPRVFERRPNGTYAREGKPLVGITAMDIQTLRAHPDGVVWFASDKGLFRYERAADRGTAAAQPAPLIRRVMVGDDRVLFDGGQRTDAVALAHNFGRMRIEFAPASFRPGVEYQYRLDPIDTEWSSWTAQPFIDYTTLEANDYTFRVRARGASMVPTREAAWSFGVKPPWYRTKWAYALWTLLALAAVAIVIRVRTASLRRQAEKLRQRVDEKTAELKSTVQLLEQANAQLEALSLEDDLTGISNRRSFDRALLDEWNRARRRDQPLALILLDLDHFKDLNDRRGHPAGDDALRRVGAFLGETIRRSGEVVARYGGEEFAILLPGADADSAIQVAEVLREGIEKLGIPYGNGGRRVTASCGVASITPAEGSAPEHLVASADRALYAAKHGGRNCVRVADETSTGTWLRDASA